MNRMEIGAQSTPRLVVARLIKQLYSHPMQVIVSNGYCVVCFKFYVQSKNIYTWVKSFNM